MRSLCGTHAIWDSRWMSFGLPYADRCGRPRAALAADAPPYPSRRTLQLHITGALDTRRTATATRSQRPGRAGFRADCGLRLNLHSLTRMLSVSFCSIATQRPMLYDIGRIIEILSS